MLKWLKELFAGRRETPASILLFEQNQSLRLAIELLNRQLAKAEERAEKFESLYLETLSRPRPEPPQEVIPSKRSWDTMRKQLEEATRKTKSKEEEEVA